MKPRLTIVIPHLDRTDFLRRSLGYAAHQYDGKGNQFPVKVLVADQGHTAETAEVMAEYADNPLVIHAKTDATSLWTNWVKGMKLAMLDDECEFVAIVQDDDVIHAKYGHRICESFDRFPNSNSWSARLSCSQDDKLAIWYSSNGPLVPMDILRNGQVEVPGNLMAPYSYFSSWCLSPAAAWRAGKDLSESLDECPDGMDLFNERTIFVAMGLRGNVIADPVTVGYWVHHGKNESYRQVENSKRQQTEKFMEWIDGMMDRCEDWEDILNKWARITPPNFLQAFAVGLDGVESRYICDVADVLLRNIADNPTPVTSRNVLVGENGIINQPVMV